MADKFATAHVGAKKAEARVNDIFVVRKTTGKGLRDFLARFNRIVYALEKLGTKVQWPQKMKSDPTTRRSNVLCEFHQERGHKTENCIGLRQEVVRMLNQGHLKELLSDKRRDNFARGCNPPQGPPKPPSPAHTIQMIIGGGEDTIVYALEKLGTKVQWPQKMKSDPTTRRSNVLCEFHQERGHKTENCIGLRQEVVRMLNQGHLKELLSDKRRDNFARGCNPPQGPPKPPSPAHTVQMIIGGGEDT
uniref:Uncharacterized protein LOC104234413 n=1 Tax=Nicotiana sylvestris TaxID=4096 RepID=A0A1U7XJC1_NICSY